MAAALVLAAADGRRVIRFKNISEAETLAAQPGIRSILIVARPSQLKNRSLLRLSARLRLPWGLITGRDLPALTFAFAKSLIARSRLGFSSAHLDPIAQRKWLWRTDSRFPLDERLDPKNTWKTLNGSDWDTVSVHCHGDGAHANFNSVVLCGVADGIEIGTGGWRGECELNGRGFRCKRVHDGQKRAFRFGDLRARHIFLFTCNGFSVAGDVYPSDASFVLSAIEGYAAAMLTTDRRLRFDRWLFAGVEALRKNGISLGRVLTLLNDLSAFTESARPYLLFGDPIQIDKQSEPSARPTSPGQATVAVRKLGSLARHPVLGLNTDSSHATLHRGLTQGLILASEDLDGLRVVDRSREFVRLRKCLAYVGERCARANGIESSLRRRDDLKADMNPAVMEVIREISLLSRKLTETTHQGAKLLARIEREGTWQPAARVWEAELQLLLALWDCRFADLLDQYLLENHLQDSLLDGFGQVSKRPGPRCVRCGCTTERVRAADLLTGKLKHEYLDCPTCGPKESHDVRLPRLRGNAPKAITRGGSSMVRLHWSSLPASHFQEEGPAILVMHLKDSGRGMVTYRAVEHVSGGAHSFNFQVPPDSALEIHTLRMALVHNLGISYLRLRTPCVPGV